jgi:DNA-3-methyladenine glycosylase II
MWGRRTGFTTLLRILLEQQVSLISARAMFDRLKLNIEPFTPSEFITRGESYLRSLGVTRQKAHYCVQIAEAFTNGELDRIGRMNDEDAHAALLRIKGVGPWTANIYLLMALKRPDIWPDGDVALASAISRLRKLDTRLSFVELAKIAERWRPYRSVAARMLWQYYLAERKQARRFSPKTVIDGAMAGWPTLRPVYRGTLSEVNSISRSTTAFKSLVSR